MNKSIEIINTRLQLSAASINEIKPEFVPKTQSIESIEAVPPQHLVRSLNLWKSSEDQEMKLVVEDPLQQFVHGTAMNLSHMRKKDGVFVGLPNLCITITDLVKFLEKHPKITSLKLEAVGIEAHDAQILATNTTLTTLEINHNNIGNVGAQALAENTTLTSLSVDCNNIGAIGAQALAKNTTLTSLNAWKNQIGDVGAETLANNTTLTSLNLDSNNIGVVGAQALAKNTTLTSLEIGFNDIGNVGAQALANNTTLTALDVESCKIQDVSAELFANNTTLTFLNISKNPVSEETLNRIKNRMNQNIKLHQVAWQKETLNNILNFPLRNINIPNQKNNMSDLISELRNFTIQQREFDVGLFPTSNESEYPTVLKTLAGSESKAEDSEIKVAILFGESNFISMMPELSKHADLVVLADIDSRMHQHTMHLQECIEKSNSIHEFTENYLQNNPIQGIRLPNTRSWHNSQLNFFFEKTLRKLISKSNRDEQGCSLEEFYFLDNEERFLRCKESLKNTPIERISLDLTDAAVCEKLAMTLKQYNAELTLCNVTNIHVYDKTKALKNSILALIKNENCYIMYSLDTTKMSTRLATGPEAYLLACGYEVPKLESSRKREKDESNQENPLNRPSVINFGLYPLPKKPSPESAHQTANLEQSHNF